VTTSPPPAARTATPTRRLVIAYAGLVLAFAVAVALSLAAGSGRHAAPSMGGQYRLERDDRCLGPSGSRFVLSQSGQFLSLDSGRGATGKLRVRDRSVTGTITCPGQAEQPVDATVRLEGGSRGTVLTGSIQARLVIPTSALGTTCPQGTIPSAAGGCVTPLTGEEVFGRLMLAIAVVILAATLFGAIVARLGQPRVMGEVLAGILLGPTLLGRVAPGITGYVFHPTLVPLLAGAADIGLAFYMFLVGLELDPRMLRGRMAQAAFVSNASVIVPLALGIAAAIFVYPLLGPDVQFLPFALFMGVSMSITAFPVLARILLERRLLRHPVGAMAIACAAVDDVTAWGLLALASGVALTGGFGSGAVRVLVLTTAFCVAMALVVRRFLARVSGAYDEAGQLPAGWIATIFIGVLLSAFVATAIGVAAIFGAFVMGLIMPRRADLTEEVTERLENFVGIVLLPLFFVVTGLRTQLGLLDRAELWVLTGMLIAIAIVGKFAGAALAARVAGMPWRESGVIGTLMNTRGLTELIVLTIGLNLKVITPALFTMLVVMALVTTFMTGPLLRLMDRKGELAVRPEEELRAAEAAHRRPVPEREGTILVAVQSERNLDALLAVAVPLATSQPPRELMVVQLLSPSAVLTSLAVEERELARVTRELNVRRASLLQRGVPVRVAAFTSPDPGGDLLALARRDDVHLILLDGRRPPATWRSWWNGRGRSPRSTPPTRCAWRSAGPSTTGRRSSSARGWPARWGPRSGSSARARTRPEATVTRASSWPTLRWWSSSSPGSRSNRCWSSRARTR
jgi:Kef-type K+ transport system membrane component KefB